MKHQQASSLKHKFLVAVPEFYRPANIFSASVVYICEHNKRGALGLIINKTTEFKLPELFERINLDYRATSKTDSFDQFVLSGGPVNTEQGFVLHTDDAGTPGSMVLGNGLAWSSSREVLEMIAARAGPKKYAVTMGFAGWAPRQLDAEMKRNMWLTSPAKMDVVFDLPIAQRLPKTMHRLGFDYNLIGPSGRA